MGRESVNVERGGATESQGNGEARSGGRKGQDTGKDDSEGLHSRTQKDDKFKDRSNFRGQEFHDPWLTSRL